MKVIISTILIALILVFSSMNIVHARNCSIGELKKIAREAANRYNVDEGLIYAMIQQESGWQDDVISHAGAVGVMQIMPGTGKSACNLSREDLFNAEKNIDCGVRYFSKQLRHFGGSVELALCAYNAGPGRAKDGLNRCNRIKETRRYIRNILSIWGKGKRYIATSGGANKKRQVLIPKEIIDSIGSAKTIADNEFIYGGYTDFARWWRLVCEAVDELYYKKIGEIKPAETKYEKNVWNRILDATVSDIYSDMKRLRKEKEWSIKKIKSKIINACPDATVENNVWDVLDIRHKKEGGKPTMFPAPIEKIEGAL